MGRHKSKKNSGKKAGGDSTSMRLKFADLNPDNTSGQAVVDTEDLAYQFQGKMRLEEFQENSISFDYYDNQVKRGYNGNNPLPERGQRFWQFKTPHSINKMRPRDGMRYIDPINMDHIFAGGRSNQHIAEAFKLSAVVDNQVYDFTYVDRKMAEIINEMSKHVSKFNPSRPILWIKYTIDKVPVLSRPKLDPYITFELTVRLVKARQTWLLNPQPGLVPCLTAQAVDRFLWELSRSQNVLQMPFPNYGGMIDGLDAAGKVLGTLQDGVLITLDEGPAPAEYTWVSDDEDEGNAGRATDDEDEGGAGRATDGEEARGDDDGDVEMEDAGYEYNEGEYEDEWEEDPNDIDEVKNAW
ncbi:hypothetical protein ACHAQA_005039 [Verticillium albo-atrum]